MSPDPAVDLFAGVDAEQLGRVVSEIGLSMVAAAAGASVRLINDPTISPQALAAGIVAAHLAGAASGMAAAERAGVLSFLDLESLDAFCADAGRFIAATVREGGR